MIARVEVHNRLNGFAFVIGESALIGVVAAAFSVLYLAPGNLLSAAACSGMITNWWVVIVLAARSAARHETGIGILRIYTPPPLRAQAAQEHPDLCQPVSNSVFA
jgi:hypothetical protein